MNGNMKIVIVDYGCGNLFSIQCALSQLGVLSNISSIPKDILEADKIILPGVGAFGDGMEKLQSYGLIEVLLEYAFKGKPVLGICLGMQLFMTESFEFGHHNGLNLIPGKVTRLSEHRVENRLIKVPHIGWSAIHFSQDRGPSRSIFSRLNNSSCMYFVHSFFVTPEDPAHCLATTIHGNNQFCAVVQKDNVVGVQFHPELSAATGLRMIQNFIYKHDIDTTSSVRIPSHPAHGGCLTLS